MNEIKICMPCYNNQETIGETLQSLSEQGKSDFSMSVFDNHSSDKTLEILKQQKSLFKEISVEELSETVPAETNFTRCIQAAAGKYTVICHSDDIYLESFLEEQVNYLEQNYDVAVIFSHARTINGEGKITGERFLPQELKNSSITQLDHSSFKDLIFKYGNFITCPTAVFRSDILKNEVKYWDGENYKSSADLDVWMRISQSHKIAFNSKPLLHYRESDSSFSFRLIKKRTRRHDLFLVLDELLKKEDITPKQKNYYEFLEFKDAALRTLNALRANSRNDIPKVKISYLKLFFRAFSSRFHLKFFILGSGLFALKWLYTHLNINILKDKTP